MTRLERTADWVMALLALAFLCAFAWPVLDPQLSVAAERACTVVVWLVWAAFLADYVVRLLAARNRRSWFVRHLFDLVILVVPIFRPLRLLRLVTLIRVVNRTAASSLRGRVVAYLAGGSVLLAFVSAVAVLDAERNSATANIKSFGDALWWSCTTMTTVGYGDRFPVTETGRLVGVGLMVAGIGLLGTVTATLASWFVETVSAESTAAAEVEGDLVQSALRAEVAELRRQVAILAELLPAPDGRRDPDPL